jgi:hypothetical protein
MIFQQKMDFSGLLSPLVYASDSLCNAVASLMTQIVVDCHNRDHVIIVVIHFGALALIRLRQIQTSLASVDDLFGLMQNYLVRLIFGEILVTAFVIN